MTTTNGPNQACASQNYAGLLFLHAVYQHRLGNSGSGLNYYHQAANDFDGHGFADLAYNSVNSSAYHRYQTYKVALYVYATYCLGQQQSAPNLTTATHTLLYLQSNSTGGFVTGYNLSLVTGPGLSLTSVGGVNTNDIARSSCIGADDQALG